MTDGEKKILGEIYDHLHEIYEFVEKSAKENRPDMILDGGGPLDVLQEQIIAVGMLADKF